MAVAIICGYGGYLLPLLAAHSSLLLHLQNIGIKTFNATVGDADAVLLFAERYCTIHFFYQISHGK